MEATQLLTPTVIVALVGAVVGLVVKAVRLQSKVDSQGHEIVELEKDNAATRALLDEHKSNENIHFNLRISQEVDKRNEQRFTSIETSLREIKEMVRGLAK